MELLAKTISYSKAKRQVFKAREDEVQNTIQELDQNICNDIDLSEQTLNEYGEARGKLQETYEKKGREAMFRSKVEWVEKGEKPTKYFFNLERKNYERKTFCSLKLETVKLHQI